MPTSPVSFEPGYARLLKLIDFSKDSFNSKFLYNLAPTNERSFENKLIVTLYQEEIAHQRKFPNGAMHLTPPATI